MRVNDTVTDPTYSESTTFWVLSFVSRAGQTLGRLGNSIHHHRCFHFVFTVNHRRCAEIVNIVSKDSYFLSCLNHLLLTKLWAYSLLSSASFHILSAQSRKWENENIAGFQTSRRLQTNRTGLCRALWIYFSIFIFKFIGRSYLDFFQLFRVAYVCSTG